MSGYVKSGDGNDFVATMAYCSATVETGNGDDEVYALGLVGRHHDAGGAALIQDDPLAVGFDFVFAKFNGISAQDLQVHIDQNTTFI